MHMIDALVSPAVGAVMWAGSAGAVGYAAKKITGTEFSEKKLPVMAVSGAFVFAAQMINFTIPGTGSSGHIGGGILLAALLGEFPALLTLSAVLIIQCLFFADGGLLALGANIFNMGVIPCLIVFPLIFRPILKQGITKKRLSAAAVISAILGLQLGAFGVVLETQASGITQLPFRTFVAMMQPIHLAIGIGEGLVTAAVLAFVYQMRPELIESAVNREKLEGASSVRKVTVCLAILALLVGGGLSLFASSNPDGLEWSMEKVTGSGEMEADGAVYDMVSSVQEKTAFLPDYDFEAGKGTGTGVSGVVGAICTSALALVTGAVIVAVKKRKKQSVTDEEE
ncbi:MAG: energy-coupling factor ABC transporter permease [Clostridium sp.]|nr:energy-coupling factor ABC transporter permease [Clostridium sp.]